MEFIISRNILLRALNHTRCAITKGELKMFKNFVFTFPDDPKEATMTVHASNGDVWITETVLLDAPAQEPRPITVWYDDLLRPIKSLEEQPLKFTVGEYQLKVTHSCGSFRLPLSNQAEEFFAFPRPRPDAEAEDGYSIEYESPGLRSILSRLAFAMAQDELRPAMNGVFVNLTESYADYVSSDGHRLVRVRKSPVYCGGIATVLSFIIPAPIVRTLLRLLPTTGDVKFEYQKELLKEKTRTNSKGKKETYTVVERKAAARIVIDDNLTLTFLTVEGRYPAYWNVIPENYNFQMTVERLPLVKSVDRLSLFQPDSGLLELNISKENIHLTTEDADFSLAGEETVPCECVKHDGTAMQSLGIGFKAPSLAATLKVLSSEKVIFHITDASRACIILPVPQPDVEEITMLLMPMLIFDR